MSVLDDYDLDVLEWFIASTDEQIDSLRVASGRRPLNSNVSAQLKSLRDDMRRRRDPSIHTPAYRPKPRAVELFFIKGFGRAAFLAMREHAKFGVAGAVFGVPRGEAR
jgi:hypothetical protein